jgi:hypothetical protein
MWGRGSKTQEREVQKAVARRGIAVPFVLNRSGVTKSYYCEVRTHAWEYAKVTLPHRSDFRSAYDALQLRACGVPAPETKDQRCFYSANVLYSID